MATLEKDSPPFLCQDESEGSLMPLGLFVCDPWDPSHVISSMEYKYYVFLSMLTVDIHGFISLNKGLKQSLSLNNLKLWLN
ncbi:hypothetical protein CR513_33318, partial [Mucuna pruriens]